MLARKLLQNTLDGRSRTIAAAPLMAQLRCTEQRDAHGRRLRYRNDDLTGCGILDGSCISLWESRASRNEEQWRAAE